MASSTEEPDSRTVAFHGKRKQPPSFRFEKYVPDLVDKRLKLDPENEGRPSSGGETAASIFSNRSKESSATSEDHEAEDLHPERASRFGWTSINNNDTTIDPFTKSYQTPSIPTRHVVDGPVMQPIGAKANAVFAKLQQKTTPSIEDHQIMAQWLETNDKGLRADVIQNSGLKARVIQLMRAENLDEGPGVAKALGIVSQGGDYSLKGRSFVKERFYIIRNSPAPDDTRTAALGTSTNSKKPDWGSAALIKLDDIQNHSLRSKMQKVPKVNRKDSIEETLRAMVVDREPSFKQAEKFLALFYQARNITGARLDILQQHSQQDLGIAEIEKAMSSPTGFLRPLIRTDLPSLTNISTAECMDKSSNTSFATALFLQARSSTTNGSSARRRLENFIKIKFVGGDQNSSIHSRIGWKDLLSATSDVEKAGGATDTRLIDAAQKLTSLGVGALTLEELEDLLPKPGKDPKEILVRRKAKTQQHIENMWKRPNSLNCLVAWQLLQLIKTGNALPNARSNLNKFVEVLHGLAVGEGRPDEQPRNDPITEQDEEESNPQFRMHELPAPQITSNANGSNASKAWPINEDWSVSDIEPMLSNQTKFTRPLEQRDLVGDVTFVNAAKSLHEKLNISLEEIVLHLAKSEALVNAAQRTLREYIQKCHRPSRAQLSYGNENAVKKATAGATVKREACSEEPAHGMNANTKAVVRLLDQGEAGSEATGEVSPSRNNAQSDRESRPEELRDRAEQVQQPQQHTHPINSGALQRRYSHTTASNSPIRCLCCGKQGHAEESCPSRTCSHCGAIDEHFSSACPINHKCGRCRQRGHTTAACTSLLSSLRRGLTSQCDICGRQDHVEEECSDLWRSFINDDAPMVQIAPEVMVVSCYNCGASGHGAHWGDDCPKFSAYDRSVETLNPIWSKKSADKFIQNRESIEQSPVTGRGSVPSYQLAMLGDM